MARLGAMLGPATRVKPINVIPQVEYMEDPQLYGLYMACIWLVYGLYMACIWLVYGLYMACIWLVYGLYMACIWLVYGLYMACIWLVYGLYMACVWLVYGLYMACISGHKPLPEWDARHTEWGENRTGKH